MNIKIYDQNDFPTYLPKLNRLYDDLFSGGKGFRARLVQLVSDPLKLDEKTKILLAQTVEFIHNSSLLHDDLIDRSHLRRGKPAAWTKYSPEYAVLAGDYLLARVMVNLSGHGNLELVHYTSQIISDLLEGEWIQDSLVKDWDVTLEQLDQVHRLKTSTLFRWCLRAPFIAKGGYDEKVHSRLEELGMILGQLFQRSDDLLDFDIRNEEKKAVLGDLKSGYLNSFSAFLVDGLKESKKSAFLAAITMVQVKAAVGEDHFRVRLHEFDELNKGLIELYNHYVDELAERLSDSEKALADQLKKLPDPLYWRKKSP